MEDGSSTKVPDAPSEAVGAAANPAVDNAPAPVVAEQKPADAAKADVEPAVRRAKKRTSAPSSTRQWTTIRPGSTEKAGSKIRGQAEGVASWATRPAWMPPVRAAQRERLNPDTPQSPGSQWGAMTQYAEEA